MWLVYGIAAGLLAVIWGLKQMNKQKRERYERRERWREWASEGEDD